MRTARRREKIACLLANGFEDSEFRVPYDRLRQAGYEVDIIGTRAGDELRGEHQKEVAKTTLSISEVDVADYEGMSFRAAIRPTSSAPTSGSSSS